MRITCPAAAAAALLIGTSAQAAATNFPAQQSTIKWSRSSAVNSYFNNYARATSTVVYDPATDTYTIRDTGSVSLKSAFGPGNIDAAQSDASFTLYSKKSGRETFRVLNQGMSNPLIHLSYVDYGEWRRHSTTNGITSVDDTYLVWGNKTTAANLPVSGTASYNTLYDGFFVDSVKGQPLDGTGTITADFGAGSLSYTAAINGVPAGALAFSGNGLISSRNGGFSTKDSSGAYTLSQFGNFYGPHAEEVGGLFHLTGPTGNGHGAFVGNQ